jgi:hypothetical protein
MRVAALLVAWGLSVTGPALALDLTKEKVVPVSEPCPGKPGFVRMPGTRSCTRLSGRVAAQAGTGGAYRPAAQPDIAGRIAIDNRTETDFGEVRTYVRIGNGRR